MLTLRLLWSKVCATRLQTREFQHSHIAKMKAIGIENYLYEPSAFTALGTGHPTITSPELGLRVLHGFANDFRPPTADEGFDRILYLRPSDHASPSYTAEEIDSILIRIGDSGDPANGNNPSGQLTRQRDFMANYVSRGGHNNGGPSRRGGYYSNRGYSRGSGRSRPYHTGSPGRREWTREAPIRRQTPHSQSSWRSNNVHEDRAAIEGTSSTPRNVAPTSNGSADSPIIIP
jgi:hypothetical protein